VKQQRAAKAPTALHGGGDDDDQLDAAMLLASSPKAAAAPKMAKERPVLADVSRSGRANA
jgi:hypothetical protein